MLKLFIIALAYGIALMAFFYFAIKHLRKSERELRRDIPNYPGNPSHMYENTKGNYYEHLERD